MRMLLPLLFIVTTAVAQIPRLSDEELEKITPEAIQKTREHQAQLVKEAQGNAIKATQLASDLSIKLEQTSNTLNQALQDVDKAQKEANALKDWGIEQQKLAHEYMVKYEKANKAVWVRNFIILALGIAILGYVALKMGLLSKFV